MKVTIASSCEIICSHFESEYQISGTISSRLDANGYQCFFQQGNNSISSEFFETPA